MRAAGYILTGLRRLRSRAHPPIIIAHGLTTDFFGIDELAQPYPDYETFWTWPATARVLWRLRQLDELTGQTTLADFATWWNPETRRITICTEKEAARMRALHMATPPNMDAATSL